MKNHQPHQNINSPVKGKYNFNNINQYTIAELSYVIHKLRKRIVDKEKYITFLKTELEENGIEYKRKFIKLKKFQKEEDKDYSLDSLLKHEKNIKKKMRKRRRKANEGDIHPELAEPLESKENVTVPSLVDTPERKEDHSLTHAQPNSVFPTEQIIEQNIEELSHPVVNVIGDPMEELSKKLEEDLAREQAQIEENKKREEENKNKRYKGEYYLRKVRKIQNSQSLYKELLLGDKEGIYSINDDELNKLLSITQEEDIQEELRRVKQKVEKTEDGSKSSVFKKKEEELEEINTESKKKKKRVIVEEKKEEVIENVQPEIGHRREEKEPTVYKQKKGKEESFIEALHRTISEEIEKDEKKEKKEPEEEDEKEIDKILRLEKEEMEKQYGGKELTYYLFSSFWKNNLNNEDYRKKKINRMKKILKEIENEDDKEHLRKHIAYAKQYKNQ